MNDVYCGYKTVTSPACFQRLLEI